MISLLSTLCRDRGMTGGGAPPAEQAMQVGAGACVIHTGVSHPKLMIHESHYHIDSIKLKSKPTEIIATHSICQLALPHGKVHSSSLQSQVTQTNQTPAF